ncbi:MAG: hypothetical protein DRR19_32640 [Candidatus Parabeggiatoa sp. nov. 1]|nr:MAG: hypothetical protein DRR19_32640 [Gammaproteobacteria bacterium]
MVVKEVDTSVRLEKVYNFTVANTHNYFVGVDGVLVHNVSKNDKAAMALGAIMQLYPVVAPVELPPDYNPHPGVTEPSPLKEKVRPDDNKGQGKGGGKGKGRGKGKNPNGGRNYPKIPPKCLGI